MAKIDVSLSGVWPFELGNGDGTARCPHCERPFVSKHDYYVHLEACTNKKQAELDERWQKHLALVDKTKVKMVYPTLRVLMSISVDSLGLSTRSGHCLFNANIKNLGDLVVRTEAELLRTKNFGRKSLNEIKSMLAARGLKLGLYDLNTLNGLQAYQKVAGKQ